jgi:3-hydroxymyristoyl/3-hydroxydecanoyl-(acyl carrier protein) dehydratase
MRFYLLDRVTECEPGKRAAGIKAVSLSEDYMEHHFAGVPVMPGSLILEGLAQLAGYLCARTAMPEAPHKHKAVLSVVEKAKFYHPVRPGDTMRLEAALLSIHPDSAMCDGTASVGDQRVATARLMFSFHTLENEILEANRRETFAIWTTGSSGAQRSA